MILIEEIKVDNTNIRFYDGIDFNEILNHAKDGSNGFIFCYIDSWEKEVKSYERDSKLVYILNKSKFNKFKSEYIDNNYVSIYQLSNTKVETLHQIIKEKVINNQFHDHPWVPISGFSSGGWKISNSEDPN